jgi:hypothetical protein
VRVIYQCASIAAYSSPKKTRKWKMAKKKFDRSDGGQDNLKKRFYMYNKSDMDISYTPKRFPHELYVCISRYFFLNKFPEMILLKKKIFSIL